MLLIVHSMSVKRFAISWAFRLRNRNEGKWWRALEITGNLVVHYVLFIVHNKQTESTDCIDSTCTYMYISIYCTYCVGNGINFSVANTLGSTPSIPPRSTASIRALPVDLTCWRYMYVNWLFRKGVFFNRLWNLVSSSFRCCRKYMRLR